MGIEEVSKRIRERASQAKPDALGVSVPTDPEGQPIPQWIEESTGMEQSVAAPVDSPKRPKKPEKGWLDTMAGVGGVRPMPVSSSIPDDIKTMGRNLVDQTAQTFTAPWSAGVGIGNVAANVVDHTQLWVRKALGTLSEDEYQEQLKTKPPLVTDVQAYAPAVTEGALTLGSMFLPQLRGAAKPAARLVGKAAHYLLNPAIVGKVGYDVASDVAEKGAWQTMVDNPLGVSLVGQVGARYGGKGLAKALPAHAETIGKWTTAAERVANPLTAIPGAVAAVPKLAQKLPGKAGEVAAFLFRPQKDIPKVGREALIKEAEQVGDAEVAQAAKSLENRGRGYVEDAIADRDAQVHSVAELRSRNKEIFNDVLNGNDSRVGRIILNFVNKEGKFESHPMQQYADRLKTPEDIAKFWSDVGGRIKDNDFKNMSLVYPDVRDQALRASLEHVTSVQLRDTVRAVLPHGPAKVGEIIKSQPHGKTVYEETVNMGLPTIGQPVEVPNYSVMKKHEPNFTKLPARRVHERVYKDTTERAAYRVQSRMLEDAAKVASDLSSRVTSSGGQPPKNWRTINYDAVPEGQRLSLAKALGDDLNNPSARKAVPREVAMMLERYAGNDWRSQLASFGKDGKEGGWGKTVAKVVDALDAVNFQVKRNLVAMNWPTKVRNYISNWSFAHMAALKYGTKDPLAHPLWWLNQQRQYAKAIGNNKNITLGTDRTTGRIVTLKDVMSSYGISPTMYRDAAFLPAAAKAWLQYTDRLRGANAGRQTGGALPNTVLSAALGLAPMAAKLYKAGAKKMDAAYQMDFFSDMSSKVPLIKQRLAQGVSLRQAIREASDAHGDYQNMSGLTNILSSMLLPFYKFSAWAATKPAEYMRDFPVDAMKLMTIADAAEELVAASIGMSADDLEAYKQSLPPKFSGYTLTGATRDDDGTLRPTMQNSAPMSPFSMHWWLAKDLMDPQQTVGGALSRVAGNPGMDLLETVSTGRSPTSGKTYPTVYDRVKYAAATVYVPPFVQQFFNENLPAIVDGEYTRPHGETVTRWQGALNSLLPLRNRTINEDRINESINKRRQGQQGDVSFRYSNDIKEAEAELQKAYKSKDADDIAKAEKKLDELKTKKQAEKDAVGSRFPPIQLRGLPWQGE